MMRVLILMLSTFVSGGTNRVTTTCTAEACLTLHLEEERFEQAHQICVENGGNLVTMRNHNELEIVKSALLASGERSVRHSKLWIGLELVKGNCTNFNAYLHGYKWTSEPTVSKYSNWKKSPSRTCTEKRCVSVSLVDGLKWTDGTCRDSAFYMCTFLSKGMCKPIAFDKPGDVNYSLPFLTKPLNQNDGLAMLPHGTLAEIQCNGSEDGVTFTSLCDNKNGPFDWTTPGRFCARDKISCKHKNGGCDHLCLETNAAGVRCECREGYYLTDDRVSCVLRINCENSPCKSKCVSTSTGFSCACPDGFRLARDNISCVDIDECLQSICGEHKCRNNPGSYFCECKPGFGLLAGKCEDVDECTEFRCDQGCLNSEGSFSCYCHAGYSSSSDESGTCIDIDECVNKPCEDICFNTLGSYKCSCRQNFTLAENGISCVPTPTSQNHEEALITELDQLADAHGPSTINPLSHNETNTKTESTKRSESFLGLSWILMCVLGSVIPLLLLIVLTSVFVIYRWKRSKKAIKKNATADNYCWVSSGLEHQEKEQR
ncbi:complement component C1q receptor [Xyrauchen texanus]|uniref:complement component C1q receptor n=1 Tax=Xyrauchen texanus TaxID=154827 RepID=UPI0022420B76|nr:complement component C1q receptor [Xyrauchen texanus]